MSEEGSNNSTGAVVLVLVPTPTTHSSSKGQKGAPKLACDTDPQTGTRSGPGICL